MKAISLFSGCGGLDLGVTQAGFKVIAGNDLDSLCAASHRTNFPRASFQEGNVTDFLASREFREATGQGVDLLVGGPPCPPFSKSRFYRKDMPRALDDPIGQETITGYLRALKMARPRAFLLENVPGMAYKVHDEALQLIIGTAKKYGYTCSWRILNAADYGVPQIRQRFFMVGMRGGEFSWPAPSHSETGSDSLAPWVTAGEAIGDLDTEENADDEGHFAGGQHHALLRQVPPGQNYLHFTKERGHPEPRFKWRSRYWSFLLKLSPDLPSWTIQARRSNNMGPFHWRNRILRIEEIKRLQTFPDEWQLHGRVEQQWRQVGNAVPPLLGRVLAKSIRSQLTATKRPVLRA